MTIDDETALSRFLDGEMDQSEAAAFEMRLESEPELAARLERWLEADRAVAGDLARLLDAIPAPALRHAPAAPVDLAAHRAAKAVQPARRWFVPTALAASVAAAGLLSISLLRSGETGPLPALETLPSGQSVTLADGNELTAVLSFAAADGRWCREFALGQRGGVAGSGVACRENGVWRAQGRLADGAAAPVDTSAGYATAAGADPAALDELYAALGAGDPIGSSEESALMENGWTGRVK